MKITAIQLDARYAAERDPYAYAEKMVRRAAKEAPDVILLPEKWNAFGHPKTHRDQADPEGEKTRNLLGPLAREYGVNLVGGSVIELKRDKLYNTAHVFDREGEEILVYDKVHLYQRQEQDYYAAGDTIGLVELDGVGCGVAICYDMDFPEWIRCYALAGAEILLAPFAWPSKWMAHLELVQKARALENQCFVAAAGLCKSDGKGNFRSGGSAIVGPKGNFIARAQARPGIISGEVREEELEEARRWQHFLDDRRGDLYSKYGF